MQARIYKPARNAMQSGQANAKDWILEFAASESKVIDPLMGWSGSSDTQSQIKLRFASKHEAVAYAGKHGLAFRISEPKPRKQSIRPGGYGDNFAYSRRGAWTH